MEPRELAGHMASGVVAGTAVEAALYPIDTIKTRLQAARGGAAVSWRHLYKGLSGNLVGVVPACALFFAVYEPAKRALLPTPRRGRRRHRRAPPSHRRRAPRRRRLRGPRLLARARAHGSRQDAHADRAVLQRARRAAPHRREGGPPRRGALRGVRIVPPQGPPVRRHRVRVVRTAQARVVRAGGAPSSTAPRPATPPGGTDPEEEKAARGEGERTRRPLKQHESAVLGAVAGMVTGAVTTPLDVVKTRLMTQGAEGRGGGGGRAEVSRRGGLRRQDGQGGGRGRRCSAGIQPRVTFIGIGGVFFFALEAAKGVFVAES